MRGTFSFVVILLLFISIAFSADLKQSEGRHQKTKKLSKEEHLFNAAVQGVIHEVRKAISSGANVNAFDMRSGNTALMWAAYKGHEDVARTLIKQGAKVNERSMDGKRTALLMAAYNGHGNVITLLLKNGASYRDKNDRGDSILSIASYQGHDSIIDLLLEAGSFVDDQTHDNGFASIHFAAFKGHLPTIKKLLTWDADVDIMNFNDRTPLMLAAIEGHNAVVK